MNFVEAQVEGKIFNIEMAVAPASEAIEKGLGSYEQASAANDRHHPIKLKFGGINENIGVIAG